MVRLTTDYIARCNGHTKRKRDEPTDHYLKRITHLYMAERNIEAIDNLSLCRNLTVLYLYDNKLNKTMNLGTAHNLTHLYLQNNNIRKIEGLKHLQRLTKLYLGYNNLSVIEGLQPLVHLVELNVEYQRLPPGEKLLFEPRTLIGLRNCLKCLNISGNHLDSLTDLRALHELTNLQACDNDIGEFSSVHGALVSWVKLEKLDLTGNPICHKSKYRDKVIVMSRSMEILDGREIGRMERQFLVSLNASREARRRQKMESQKNEEPSDLPPLHHPPAPSPPPHYMMGGLPGGRKRFEAILAKSRSLPNSAAIRPLGKKPLAPYTTPRMASTIMEHEPRLENEMLGQKSISDLTDAKRKLERQVTPHPNMSRRGKVERIPHHVVSSAANGVKPETFGGGDPLGGRTVSGFYENAAEPFVPKALSHPSFRGSRMTVRPSLEGATSPEKSMQNRNGEVNFENSINRLKTRTPSANREAVNGENSLLIVANGPETQNGVSDQSKQ